MSEKSWVLDVKHDESTGDKYIELTEEILQESGFKVGDSITWVDNHDGSYTLVRSEDMPKTFEIAEIDDFKLTLTKSDCPNDLKKIVLTEEYKINDTDVESRDHIFFLTDDQIKTLAEALKNNIYVGN